MLLKYNAGKIDFVNTSEAYSSKLYVGRNNILIPFINIGLMSSNPINSKESVIDYSYYLLREVYKTSFSMINEKLEEVKKEVDVDLINEYIMIGGFQNVRLQEIEVFCKGRYLYFADNAIISNPLKPFVPRPTPNFMQNLPNYKVDNFFNKLPVELEEILGPDYCTI